MLNGSEARAFDEEFGNGDALCDIVSELEQSMSVESHCGWDRQEDSSPPVVLTTTEAAATLVGVASGEETAAGEEVNIYMQSEPTCNVTTAICRCPQRLCPQ